MRLRSLREHFKWQDSTWIPKKPFESEEDVRNKGFYKNQWYVYRCRLCRKFHIADKNKKVIST